MRISVGTLGASAVSKKELANIPSLAIPGMQRQAGRLLQRPLKPQIPVLPFKLKQLNCRGICIKRRERIIKPVTKRGEILTFSSGAALRYGAVQKILDLELWHEFMPVSVHRKKHSAAPLLPSPRNRHYTERPGSFRRES